MRVNRWWPERACLIEVTETGGELYTHRRGHALRAPEGGVPRQLRAWTPRAARGAAAVPGPAERSPGWEVRAHNDLLYFLQSGRPRFVMSQTMAQSGYAAVVARLSGDAETAPPARPSRVAPAPVDFAPIAPTPPPAYEHGGLRDGAFSEPHRRFPILLALLAASFVVLAAGLLAAIVAGRGVGGHTSLAPGPRATPPVSAALGGQPADVAQVKTPAAVFEPSSAGPPPSAPRAVTALVRAPAAPAQVRPTPARPFVRISVSPSLRFVVVSGSMPLTVAARRVSALLASGLTEVPRVVALSATRAAVYYGGFHSKAEAQALATRVRTMGYTATVVTE